MEEKIVSAENKEEDLLNPAINAPADFTAPEILYQELIDKIRSYHPSADISMVEKAYHIADDAHKDQLRKSGEPYIIHPLCVAIILAELELCIERPGSKIIVIDSLCASLGEGLLVHKAALLKESGKTIDETADWIENNKIHLIHIFTVDDLFHLHRGGRVSKAAAIIGTLINVKPVLHVDNEGRLIPLFNVRGRKKALMALVDQMEVKTKNYPIKNNIFFISHGDCLEDAEYVAGLIKERLGIDDSLIYYVSPTIGAHSGPGTVALFFMGTER